MMIFTVYYYDKSNLSKSKISIICANVITILGLFAFTVVPVIVIIVVSAERSGMVVVGQVGWSRLK